MLTLISADGESLFAGSAMYPCFSEEEAKASSEDSQDCVSPSADYAQVIP